jgi:hypothetical protein
MSEDVWTEDPKTGLWWGTASLESMTWEEAREWAKKQDGRPPTLQEFYTILVNDSTDILSLVKNKWFWFSMPDDPSSSTSLIHCREDFVNTNDDGRYAICVRP